MLGEDNQLALASRGIAHLLGALQELREFVPLAVLTGMEDLPGLFLQALQDTDFRFEVLNSLGGGSLIYHRLFELLLLLGVQVVRVFGGRPAEGFRQDCLPALMQLLLFHSPLEPLMPVVRNVWPLMPGGTAARLLRRKSFPIGSLSVPVMPLLRRQNLREACQRIAYAKLH